MADDHEVERRATRPWWWRILLRRPRDTVAFLLAAGAAGAIVVNGLYFQRGPHPAPIFAVKPLPVAAVRPVDHVAALPRPRPLEPEAPKRDLASARTHTDGIDARARPAPPALPGPRKDPIAELLATRSQPAAAPPPQAQPAVQPSLRSSAQPSRQVLAVQRALSDFGYGQLKPTGVYDPDTRVAIQHFERDHKLPITGEISERVTRELSNLTGRSMD
jgi:Putative peptidoglycan binding domain